MSEAMDIDDPGPRGTKRKADENRSPLQAPKRIKALNQDVVNKIAAGEIIVAPMHALKELIENAVDAGSTSLEIVVKDGGLKLLQITDNGHGINKDDMPILCERFTTSKLKAFEDLASIGTYGFRGEALASISHIAHLTVTTKTADSSCAWRAHYADGKLVPAKPGQSADPKPTAGRGGTQITVEDLFYNIKQRQKAFKSSSEEYAKILDVVGRHAIHCTNVSFTCKKHGEASTSISVPSTASTIDRIRQIHGSAVAAELLPFTASSPASAYGFSATGYTTNANYHVKKTTLLLFINHRAVDSSSLKKALNQSYAPFLPKGGHPFTYLALDIDPARVDVNVHPTKREVNFLHEDEIIDAICSAIRTQLAKVDTSRTFLTQSLLPGTSKTPYSSSTTSKPLNSNLAPLTSSTLTSNPTTLIRTDPSLRKITSMLPPSSSSSTLPQLTYTTNPTHRPPNPTRLTTVLALRAAVRSSIHSILTSTLASSTYIGLVSTARRIAAIQAGVKLYLVDYGLLSNEYFYQIGLTDFGNFGLIRFSTPLSIVELVTLAVEVEKLEEEKENEGDGHSEGIDWTEIPKAVSSQLISRREMLLEYFSLEISASGDLLSLPLLVKGYVPSLAKLPRFLMRLGPCVDWKDEQRCFHTFLRELASFYTPEQLPEGDGKGKRGEGEEEGGGPEKHGNKEGDEEGKREIAERREQLAGMLEHVLFPAFRARLVATRGLLRGVVEVADLKGLYRVFERC